jgi:hypothetical protein
MKDILKDIRAKLLNNDYQNEEHVRLSLVSRIIQSLGWDVWNPREVNTEYYGTPNEDKSRVDMALFLNSNIPSVFIEVKAIGKIDTNLGNIERQLRDYNKNLTALFSVITDGKKWIFYFSQSGGEFSEKRFKTLDLLEDQFEDIETFLISFLSKSEIANGNAERDAKSYLEGSKKQRAMEDALPHARRMIDQPPFLSLPQALVERVAKSGFKISSEEAAEFIQSYKPVEKPALTIAQPEISHRSFENTPVHNELYRAELPRGLSQILEVAELILFKNTEYIEATDIVAKRWNVTRGTISSQCTRGLHLAGTEDFKSLLRDRNQAINYISKQYSKYSFIIDQRLRKN